jgi:hypothetical protein
MGDISADRGLLIPLFFISRMLTGEYADRFDASMLEWFDFYSEIQNLDDDEFAKRTVKSRREVDSLLDGLLGGYFAIRYDQGLETSFAFSKLVTESEGLGFDELPLIDSALTDALGKNKIPSLNHVIFLEYSVYGDPWEIEGIRNAFDAVSAIMSYDEFMNMIQNEPCFVFNEKECFRVSLSTKGKRFKELLGIPTIETSYWPVHFF